MAKGDYTISNIYQGGYSSLSPKYGDVFSGYRINPGSLGLTTDPRTANVIQDISTKLNAGVKLMEIAAVSPEIFDSIPKQQLKEINRLSKLTGVDITLHGPVIDTAGMSQQGFSELSRVSAERKITDVLQRSHELNPDGNSPVTFHAAEGIAGSEWKTLGKEGEERKARRIIAVNRDDGKMTALEEERLFFPAMKELKPEIEKKLEEGKITPEEIHGMTLREKYNFIPLAKGKLQEAEARLDTINHTTWDDSINQLLFNKERADEILQQNQIQIQHLMKDFDEDGESLKKQGLTATQKKAYDHWMNAKFYLDDTQQHIETLFNKAYKYGDENSKKLLTQASEQFGAQLETDKTPFGQSKAVQDLLYNLKKVPPEMFVPIEQFAVEKSSKTFGNAAFDAYKKLGDKTPILSIENPPAGFGLSTGEDLKNLVEASRKQFAERAVKEKGISERAAERLAEKFIGATWDLGHINMLRKEGFKEEDIISESEKIAPFVKHVHLSDNFGFEHTELPMGMGNVPMKQILEKLGQKGFDAKKIIEAGQWWQHFKAPPLRETLEAFGSPIYGMEMGPYWNQNPGFQQGYYGGLSGQWLPQTNYETFGTSFSRMPMELGGQRPGAEGSRMSGRGME
jgi:sugar phosphate isomerase/epimerase